MCPRGLHLWSLALITLITIDRLREQINQARKKHKVRHKSKQIVRFCISAVFWVLRTGSVGN